MTEKVDRAWLDVARDLGKTDRDGEVYLLRVEIERLRHENMRLLTANEYAFAPVGELAKLNRVIERLRDGNRPLPFDRDQLGRMVREAWVRWAQTQTNPKASWLMPYDELSEPDKEADRQIGEAIARFTLIGEAAQYSLAEPKEGSQ